MGLSTSGSGRSRRRLASPVPGPRSELWTSGCLSFAHVFTVATGACDGLAPEQVNSTIGYETDALPSPRAAPPLPLLAFVSPVFIVFSLAAWGIVAFLQTIGGYEPHPHFVLFVPLLALPGAIVGSFASRRMLKWWPFYVGLLVTLLPALLAIVLSQFFHWGPGLGAGD
jgi:hypothetical protein